MSACSGGLDAICFAWASLQLRGCNFTLISNNCWGAHIYKALKRPYATPFVGLFIPPGDYLRLLPEVASIVHADIRFISSSRHEEVESFRTRRNANYPIGLLDGRIELHFMHYQSAEDAVVKWRRRTERASWESDSLFFKFCDHDGASNEQIRCFDDMSGLSRVCFVGSRLSGTNRVVHVGCKNERVPDGGELAKVSGKYFSAVDWIASCGTGGMRPWWGNQL
jgi:uncharacterized protein (DUF1919 family)